MVTSTPPVPAEDLPATNPVSPIRLDAGGLALSGLLGQPPGKQPRAVVVALHGAGMNSRYFHGQADPGLSLFSVGIRLGFTVLALDRPGYGASADALPRGQSLTEQAALTLKALGWFADRYPTGDGFFLLAHSYGGKLALTAAAQTADAGLIGLDISGCGHRYAAPPELEADREGWRRNWGALRCYPPGTFSASGPAMADVPRLERESALRWPDAFSGVAARVRLPVRFTFAEHEGWWRHDEDAIEELAASFTSAPRVIIDRLPDSGHNISLGWTARAYHLRALGFCEECLASARCAR